MLITLTLIYMLICKGNIFFMMTTSLINNVNSMRCKTMKKTLKFGMIGSGSITETHIKSIRSILNADVTAIFSRNRETAEKLATKYSIQVYSDYEEFLSNDEMDIVTILTPSGTHADLGILAAKRGKHVIVEKPIDTTLAKTNELIRVCREANVTLSCIFQHDLMMQ